MKLLAAADVHLGRSLGGVSRALATDYSPKVAWGQLVDLAVDRSVDAVLLAGDVVDCDFSYFEAFGPLQRGINRLTRAGIDVVMVAGNHDTTVLPQLVDGLDPIADAEVVLLGRNGTWEFHDLTAADGTTCRIYGWSFPQRWHERSPFVDPWPAETPSPPWRLGLLHGDYGVADSKHAPVAGADLANRNLPLWIMGHIHLPQEHHPATGVEAWYTGSLQGLHAKEDGHRGAILIESTDGGNFRCERIPVGRLCYFHIPLETTDLQPTREAIFQALRTAIAEKLAAGDTANPVEVAVVDLHLTGASSAGESAYAEAIDQIIGDDDGCVDAGDFRFRIRRRSFDLRLPESALDLPGLAAGKDLKAMLAQILISLEEPQEGSESSTTTTELLAEIRKLISQVCARREFSMLGTGDDDLAPPDADTILRRQVYDLLRAIITEEAQAGGSDDG